MREQPIFARPATLLQAEAVCLLLASCMTYHRFFAHHWILFAGLFFVPDLSLLLFVKGPSVVASVVYNTVHAYVLPLLLALYAFPFHHALLGEISLIWTAHISMDRMIAAGLKYPSSFRFTHMQSAACPAIPSSVTA